MDWWAIAAGVWSAYLNLVGAVLAAGIIGIAVLLMIEAVCCSRRSRPPIGGPR